MRWIGIGEESYSTQIYEQYNVSEKTKLDLLKDKEFKHADEVRSEMKHAVKENIQKPESKKENSSKKEDSFVVGGQGKDNAPGLEKKQEKAHVQETQKAAEKKVEKKAEVEKKTEKSNEKKESGSSHGKSASAPSKASSSHTSNGKGGKK